VKRLLLPLLFFNLPLARAEYRAFELAISDPTTGTERTELSNLDPVQYVKYHPVKPSTKVVYKSTWMCRGNTSSQQICANPKAK
jgi:hypothetical protein